MTRGSSRLVWDGERLATELHAPGRRFRADPACFGAEPVEDAWAHVCALTADDAKLPFDFPPPPGPVIERYSGVVIPWSGKAT